MGSKTGSSVRKSVGDGELERVADALAAGETLASACRRRGMPSAGAVLRRCRRDAAAAARLAEARRIGVWALLDAATERLANAEATDLAAAKEYANHVRWLAARLVRDVFGERVRSEPGRILEVRWADSPTPPDPDPDP